MLKQSKMLMLLALILVIVSGCSNSTGNSKEGIPSTNQSSNDSTTITLERFYNEKYSVIDTENKYKPIINENEITLYVENTIFIKRTHNSYVFNGFLGQDTLKFGKTASYKAIDILHPAKIGYKFRFQEEGDIEYEIIDFNRGKGFIKLKVNKASDKIPVEIDNKGE